MPDLQAARQAVDESLDPETGRPLATMDQVASVDQAGHGVRVGIRLTSWSAPVRDTTVEALRGRVAAAAGVAAESCEVVVEPIDRPADRLGQVGVTAKSVIAVGSGKGGVGKSTIAALLAIGLKRAGAKVGLMDADVYGPSVPHLLGLGERPTAEGGRLQPVNADGMKVISMGLLVPPGEAVVWRGPMLHGAVTQMLRDTEWGDLDYLVIDMPPGTGDIALTLSQLLPLSGAVVVCTPQDVALLDAVKAVAMFRKVRIPVLGMVENMSYFLCPDNGIRYDIFGYGGAQRKAAELGVPFLGEAPINIDVRKRGDDGRLADAYEDSTIAPTLEAITRGVVEQVIAQRGGSAATPSLPVL